MTNLVQKDIFKIDDTLFLNELGHTKISYKYENILKML